jgi:hypothetical protein
MILTVLGAYLIAWTLWHAAAHPSEGFGSFPVWVRILGPTLPLVTLPRTRGRIRIGTIALAFVGLVVLNGSTLAPTRLLEALVVLGAVTMIWAGWTGRSQVERTKELKELLPWLAGLALLYAGLRIAGWVSSR